MTESISIKADEMKSVFFRILVNTGYADSKAARIADIFTVNSLEGIYTHGVNRFPRFIRNTRDGFIDAHAEPSLVHVSGSLEQWNGNLGPGPLNALAATNRALEIAGTHGMGLVAMANTNHWMRGGYYGWHAAGKGMVFIGWTNTIANMPAWGAKDPRLGNNPFVIAVPWGSDAIVLDFAMSLYSYGKMESYANEGRKLPYPGGFDSGGRLTDDPAGILESWRTLPIGYWKGASLSLLLDILAAILSGGFSVNKITEKKTEYALSQVFIAIDVSKLHNLPTLRDTVQDIIDDLHGSAPAEPGTVIRYPGENVHRIKEDSLKNGIPVARNIWEEILSL
ncbi:MAG: 3-dehydro-L-gulonate 2-dehydrogenase [Bacteroidales bacterium]|jgi:3-dehydro-L-gulonate 2-dehydrogenase|nr:3-dehydro-L-gulonate 2-dehydrogenase [Bacteroidales bacterium]